MMGRVIGRGVGVTLFHLKAVAAICLDILGWSSFPISCGVCCVQVLDFGFGISALWTSVVRAGKHHTGQSPVFSVLLPSFHALKPLVQEYADPLFSAAPLTSGELPAGDIGRC